jgi:N-methylhydantoinase A/oxoprolinase/acetone carboxylase beta subunit
VNELTAAGANRIVVAFSGEEYVAHEMRAERILVRRFPTHLLGTVPVLLSHEIVDDASVVRRAWSALLNAYLHPAMERFLYEAERRLREHRIRAPLLIFRNDGGSARVAKTTALRTYGSGPRGGMEGVRALAAHYGLSDVVSIDVGGTTTDVGHVRNGAIRSRVRGSVEGIEISFPLADVMSAGVGGSSVVRARDGEILIGPESVGPPASGGVVPRLRRPTAFSSLACWTRRRSSGARFVSIRNERGEPLARASRVRSAWISITLSSRSSERGSVGSLLRFALRLRCLLIQCSPSSAAAGHSRCAA